MPSGELTHLSLFSGIGGLDLAAEWAGFTTVGIHGAGGRGCDEQGGKRLKLGSLFDGSGGFPLSGVLNGIEPVWAAEVEPYPIAVTRSRFPHMKHYGDVSKMRGAELEPVDIVTFGSPCQDMSIAGKREGLKHEAQGDEETTRSGLFYEAIRIVKEMRSSSDGRYPRFAVWENVCFAAGTLVTCEGGYKPIERVFVGEKVKTLSGKYLPVVKVHKTKRQNVLNLSVSGGEDLVVTSNHPFYARQKTYDTGGRKTITDAQWTEAKNLTAKHLIAYRIDEPTLPEHFISETDAWILGRWLADGSVDLTKANPRIFVSVGSAKLEEVRDKLRSLPYEFYESKPHDTVTNFTFTSNNFYSLIAECGIGAGQKRVAPFIFTLPHTLQQRVLEGYMSGDGYTRKRFNGIEITAATASRELAYGIARLIRNCYKTSANISCRPARNGLIDGRVIKANYPSYNITACIGGKSSQSFFDGEFVWQPVRSIRPLKEKQDVYNLSVLEDNTYAANDIICHNCGAFSSNKGYDFHAVLEALCSVCDSTVSIPKPYDAKRANQLVWSGAGEIVGDSYSIAWRTLDAQYWGVPQRRKRIYLVADFGSERAAEILFERYSLHGNIAESGEAGQGVTADAVGGADGSVGVECLNPLFFDAYNQLSGDVSKTLNTGSDYDKTGCVVQPVIALQANGIDRADTVDRHAVCYGIDQQGGKGGANFAENTMPPMCSDSHGTPHAVCYQESVGALQARDYKGVGNQYVGEEKLIKECYDARGNGDGETACTITGDHQNSITDYTAVAAQETKGEKECAYGTKTETNTDKILQALWEEVGAKKVAEWGFRILISFQQKGVLRPCLHGKSVSDGGNGVNKVDSPAPNEPQEKAERELRGVRSEKCARCTPQRWKPSEQQLGEFTTHLQELSQQDSSAEGVLCHMWKANERAWLLRKALSEIQKAREPICNKNQPIQRRYIIRRLLPVECARLQGFPDKWGHLAPYNPADAEFWEDVRKTHAEINGKAYKPVKNLKAWYEKLHNDGAEYKMWGNGIALPCAEYVIRRIAETILEESNQNIDKQQ